MSTQWRTPTSSRILENKILEYIKLVELVVQVIGSIEDECCFSTLTFTKEKLQNQLAMHLEQLFKIGKTTKFNVMHKVEASTATDLQAIFFFVSFLITFFLVFKTCLTFG